MTTIQWNIQVEARGAKRDVYLLLHNNVERRHIFTITPFEIRYGTNRYLLRHVKKQKLGALADCFPKLLQEIITTLYHKILSISRDETGLQGFWTGKYLFTTKLFQPQLKRYEPTLTKIN
jgi:hypothetical protein